MIPGQSAKRDLQHTLFEKRLANKIDDTLLLLEHPHTYTFGKSANKSNLIFDDTEHSKIQNLLCFPFATKIYTPNSYKLNLGKKQERYQGSKEVGYLSSKYFIPDKKVLTKIGVKKGQKLIFIRLVSWEASHDVGKKGIQDIKYLIKELEKYGKIILISNPVQERRYRKSYSYQQQL